VAQVAVCAQINTKHMIQCGQSVQLLKVKLVVHHVTSRLQKVKALDVHHGQWNFTQIFAHKNAIHSMADINMDVNF